MNSTTTTSKQTITKTFTPDVWFDFQKQDAVVEVIEMETVTQMEGYKEIRVTFVWQPA